MHPVSVCAKPPPVPLVKRVGKVAASGVDFAEIGSASFFLVWLPTREVGPPSDIHRDRGWLVPALGKGEDGLPDHLIT